MTSGIQACTVLQTWKQRILELRVDLERRVKEGQRGGPQTKASNV